MLTAQMIWDMIEEKNHNADEALKTLTEAVIRFSNAERDYRKTKSIALIEYGDEVDPITGKKRTVGAIEALRDQDERVLETQYERNLAEGMKQVAVEEIRLRTTQVSAAQTIAGAFKSEARFEQTKPQMTP